TRRTAGAMAGIAGAGGVRGGVGCARAVCMASAEGLAAVDAQDGVARQGEGHEGGGPGAAQSKGLHAIILRETARIEEAAPLLTATSDAVGSPPDGSIMFFVPLLVLVGLAIQRTLVAFCSWFSRRKIREEPRRAVHGPPI